MKNCVFILCFLLCSFSMSAQIHLEGYRQGDINPELLKGKWKAQWISLPDEPFNVFGVYHFRKTFELQNVPEKFIVHVTADNRYKLYANGQFVSLGPSRGDLYNWNFETVDLAPYLKEGKNVLAAIVWNFSDVKPVAQISFNHTGFLLQGNTGKEEVVNTNDSWLCTKNEAYQPWQKPIRGYYAAGASERLTSSFYPWGWEQPDYDDSNWKHALAAIQGAVKGTVDYPCRLLVPTPIPPMENKLERFKEVRIADGVKIPSGFPARKSSFTIPANSKVNILLDNKQLTTGYLSFLFSKGKDAEITIGYTESLYLSEKGAHPCAKGNRNVIENKIFSGYEDKIIADGGDDRNFTSLWWRTWRYVDLTVQTARDPLVVEDIYGTFSAYPFKRESDFSAPGHEELKEMLDIGWHTARLCANETYMDCPYYEQLQYFGDTRIQAMITMYNTHDQYMAKNAIEQGRQSIVSDGITMSRYPSNLHQFISSYSLSWCDMGYDYWMYRGDEEYLKSVLPAFRNILAWYEQWLKPDNSLAYIPNWFFADWAAGYEYGQPIREENGNSAFQDLMFILTLEHVAQMEKAFGIPPMGEHYTKIAAAIRQTIRKKYWVESRGLFADTYDHHSFSQHVNSLAILAGIVKGDEAAEVMKRTLNDPSLTQATIYFRYYVHQAMNAVGLGDLLLDNLKIWRDQMALGLTTWAETPEPSRSDCHAWGASLNIEFYRILLGIDSDAPGFRKIRISPSLGNLKEVSGTMPHPAGFVSASYKIDTKGHLTAQLSLPPSTSGTFVWKGKEYPLKAGEQTLTLK